MVATYKENYQSLLLFKSDHQLCSFTICRIAIGLAVCRGDRALSSLVWFFRGKITSSSQRS